jgi:hypothetical protein
MLNFYTAPPLADWVHVGDTLIRSAMYLESRSSKVLTNKVRATVVFRGRSQLKLTRLVRQDTFHVHGSTDRGSSPPSSHCAETLRKPRACVETTWREQVYKILV